MKRLTLAVLSLFFVCSFAQAQECPDDKFKEAEITISYGDAFIKADPATVKVCQRGTITVTLAPEVSYEVMEVELKPRMKEEKWLKKAVRAVDLKKNGKTKKSQFKIKVREDQAAGLYKYYVKVPGVGYLDPRVEVIGLH